jgi:hypothetical protein
MRKFKFLGLLIIMILLSSCNNDFGIWVRGMTNEVTITTKNGDKFIPFEKEFYVDYYITKSVTDQNVIKAIMANNINRVYKLIDNNNEYLDDNNQLINNVKVIIDSVNNENEVIVDQELFNLLVMAKNESISNSSYSMFANNLNKWWDNLFAKYKEDQSNISLDPYYNQNSKTEIEKIVACIPHTQDDIDKMLLLNPNTKGVKFSVKEECFDDKVFPRINLNSLAKVYLTKIIKQELLDSSFNQGLLYVGGNLVTTLGKAIDKWSFALRDPNSANYQDLKTIATIILKDEYTAFAMDDFPLNRNYYFVDDVNHQVIYRHPYVNALTGYPNNAIRSIIGFSYSLSPLDIFYTVNDLFNINNEVKIKDNIIPNLEVLYLTQEGISDNKKCEGKSWCPSTTITLNLKVTSELNKIMQIKSGVNLTII